MNHTGSGIEEPANALELSSISIVIPHVDSYPKHAHCLETVLKGLPACVEVVTVEDGVSPLARDPLEPYAVRAVRQPRRTGAGSARNRGAREARGEFLVFLDSDISVCDGFFNSLKERLETLPERTIVQGVYAEWSPHQNGSSQYKNLYYRYNFFHRHSGVGMRSLSSHCFVLRRKDFQDLGGFDERMSDATVEDAELGLRALKAGYSIVLDPGLEVIHHKRYSLPTLLRTDFNLCRGKVKVWLRHALAVLAKPSLIAISGVALNRMNAVALSVLLTPLSVVVGIVSPAWGAALLALVLSLNARFYYYLQRAAGSRVAAQGIVISLLDYTAAFGGACAGLIEFASGFSY